LITKNNVFEYVDGRETQRAYAKTRAEAKIGKVKVSYSSFPTKPCPTSRNCGRGAMSAAMSSPSRRTHATWSTLVRINGGVRAMSEGSAKRRDELVDKVEDSGQSGTGAWQVSEVAEGLS